MAARCPHCNVPLTQDEERSGQCPACGMSLDAPRARDESVKEGRPTASSRGEFEELSRSRPAAREYDDEDDRPIRRRSSGSDLDPGWGTAQAGLNTMFFGYLTVVISYVLFFLGMILVGVAAAGGGFGGGGRGGDANVLVMVPSCLFIIGVFGGAISHLVGMFMCLASPEGKGWMGGSLAFFALYILMIVGMVIFLFSALDVRGGPNPNAPVAMIAWMIATYGVLFMGIVCLVIFLKRIAQYFHNSFLQIVSNVYLVLWVVTIGLGVSLFFVIANAGDIFQIFQPRGGGFGQLGAAVLGIYGVMLLCVLTNAVLYAIMLRSARNTIARAGEAY